MFKKTKAFSVTVNRKRFKNSYILFSAPALILYSVFFIYPAFRGILYAFTNWDGLSPNYDFILFENFKRMVQIEQLRIGVLNTFKYCILFLLFVNSVAIILATLINSTKKIKNFFKTAFFIPMIISSVVISYVWSSMYAYETGAINSLLRTIGLDFLRQEWLGDEKLAIVSIVVTMVWGSLGLYLVIYSTVIEGISAELYEASVVDGASSLQKFWNVTFPMIAPAMTICVVLSTVTGLKIFDFPFIMTKGGPVYATESITTLIYKLAFRDADVGLACAYSLVLLIAVSIISFVQTTMLRKREVNL